MMCALVLASELNKKLLFDIVLGLTNPFNRREWSTDSRKKSNVKSLMSSFEGYKRVVIFQTFSGSRCPTTISRCWAFCSLLDGVHFHWPLPDCWPVIIGVRSRSRFVRLIDALPGPKTLPLLGNILELVKYISDSNKISKLIQLTCLLFAFLMKWF